MSVQLRYEDLIETCPQCGGTKTEKVTNLSPDDVTFGFGWCRGCEGRGWNLMEQGRVLARFFHDIKDRSDILSLL